MNTFTIQPNNYLNQCIQAFFHSDYSGGGQWKINGTIENIICTLKNDITPYQSNILQTTQAKLTNILQTDLPQILRQSQKSNLTVCVIPRAKVNYRPDQLLFKKTVSDVVNLLNGFTNGTNYISRHSDTKTTHLKNGISGGGTGMLPYPGITKKTCNISENVINKDILLIDDLYTKSVNIDEDAIQALIDNGAKSVLFYAVGNTICKNLELSSPTNSNDYDDDLPF